MTTNNTSKEYLAELIAKLVKLGEDKEELALWVELYDAMSEEEREKLFSNLEKELAELEAISTL